MFAIVLSFAVNADAKDDAVKKDLAALEGEWTMVSAERDGMKLPDELLKNSKRTAKGNESTVMVGGQLFMKATVTLDPSKKPKTIDYDVTDGPNRLMAFLNLTVFPPRERFFHRPSSLPAKALNLN
jgi:uncharacterized protein (TIGR03067 family)